MSKPKKQPQRRNKKLNLTHKERWERIIKDVEKNEIPIKCIESITITLVDDTEIDVNIRELLAEGSSPDDLEEIINEKLESMDHLIKDVDFYINVESVAKTIQPYTDQVLKNL